MSLSAALNTAIQGMSGQSVRFLHIGNNIATSTTTAFKNSDISMFENMSPNVSSPGGDGSRVQPGVGVTVSGTVTDFAGGQIKDDLQPGHLAIIGDGYLSVVQGSTSYLTRAGDFSLVENPANKGATPPEFVLSRPNGAILQGAADVAGALAGPVTFQERPESFSFAANGEVTALPATVTVVNGHVGLRRFLNQNALIKKDAQMFAETTESMPFTTDPEVPGATGSGYLRQGALEQSNVDLTAEFTKMIITQRAFTANSKTITTADELLNTVINMKR